MINPYERYSLPSAKDNTFLSQLLIQRLPSGVGRHADRGDGGRAQRGVLVVPPEGQSHVLDPLAAVLCNLLVAVVHLAHELVLGAKSRLELHVQRVQAGPERRVREHTSLRMERNERVKQRQNKLFFFAREQFRPSIKTWFLPP